MASTFAFHRSLLHLEAIKLGRFVRNRADPESDYFDPPTKIAGDDPELDLFDRPIKTNSAHPQNPIPEPKKTHLPVPTVLRDVQDNFSEMLEHSKGTKLEAMLTSFLSGTRSRDKKTTTNVESSRAITYKLDNSGLWFMQATELESVRRWMEFKPEAPAYLVVGFHTLLDAAVSIEESLDTLKEGKVQIPVTETLAATGVPLPGPLTGGEAPLNPRFGGSRKRGRVQHTSYNAVGEKIYAVQYQKITVRPSTSKGGKGTSLKPTAEWTNYLSSHRKEGARKGDGEITAGIGVPIPAGLPVGIEFGARREFEMMTATLEDEGADFHDRDEHDVVAVWAGPIGKEELFLVGR